MTLRAPPGRMGVVWLRERLAIAERARAVLEEEVEALSRELSEIERTIGDLEREWQRLLARAERSLLESELSTGADQVGRFAALTEVASTTVTVRRTLGVPHPDQVAIEVPAVGTGWASSGHLRFTTEAYREALGAGARLSASARALRIMTRARSRTAQRLRSIERRWIPALRDRLRETSRGLDEAEREDTVRISWAADRERGLFRPPGA